jgi:N-acetylglutamate synthase-like GNAT family acetyltransferase
VLEFHLRKATSDDEAAIAEVIAASVRGLAKGIYDERQIELSIRSVFGVDDQLIADQTYFVAEANGNVVGCGGWSFRKTLYGASGYAHSREPEMLEPAFDAAKIRAFFVHPDAARNGIGRAILTACENEARDAGFRSSEMMATLPGVPLYQACGYNRGESYFVPLEDNITIECIKMSKKLV